MSNRVPTLTILALSLICAGQSAPAQVQRSGSDVARVMQQLQQATAERSKLQQENDGLKKELEKLKADLSKANSEQARLQQRAKELTAAAGNREAAGNRADSEALEKTRSQLQELVAKFRETAQTLKEVESDRQRLRGEQANNERELKTCVDRNANLYLVSGEILDRMANRGLWSGLAEKEPFTRLSRTRLENLIEDYRYRVDELKLANRSTAASTK